MNSNTPVSALLNPSVVNKVVRVIFIIIIIILSVLNTNADYAIEWIGMNGYEWGG